MAGHDCEIYIAIFTICVITYCLPQWYQNDQYVYITTTLYTKSFSHYAVDTVSFPIDVGTVTDGTTRDGGRDPILLLLCTIYKTLTTTGTEAISFLSAIDTTGKSIEHLEDDVFD